LTNLIGAATTGPEAATATLAPARGVARSRIEPVVAIATPRAPGAPDAQRQRIAAAVYDSESRRGSTQMSIPSDRRYAASHEWFLRDGDRVTIGITQFAADQLTDVTYAAMKPLGTRVEAGGTIGEVESVKTTSDIYSAIAGEIIEVNESISSDPSLVNSDPYGGGWMVRVRCDDPAPLEALMDAAAYEKSLASA